MSEYRCFAFSNYEIDKETYNYLLPIYGICAFENGFKRNKSSPFIFVNNEKCFFCGTLEDYKEMAERCRFLL